MSERPTIYPRGTSLAVVFGATGHAYATALVETAENLGQRPLQESVLRSLAAATPFTPRTTEERDLRPLSNLTEGPDTPGFLHTFVCPGCDQSIDMSHGRLMVQPLGKSVLAWWHADCRDLVIAAIGQN